MTNKDPKGYYQTLNLSPNASSDEIKKSYKKLAMKWHPDKNPQNTEEATEKFKKIAEAYDVLGNEEKRRLYDSNDFFDGNFSSNSNTSHFHSFNHHNNDESIRRAFEMFNHFFANDPFFQMNNRSQRNMGHPNDFFQTPFFNDPFFSMSNHPSPMMNNFSSFSTSGSGQSVSTKITTTIGSDGKKIIRKESTIIHPDGRRETTIEENNGENMNIQHRIL
jgi:DnaJ family protein B protein 6